MARPQLKLTVMALLTLASCSQILGISDYDIDKSLDAPVGGETNEGGTGGGVGGGEAGGGGTTQAGGEAGKAGDAPIAGGEAGMAGAGGAPDEELIDCDSAACCDRAGGVIEGQELLLNGDFEAGRTDWGTSSENDFDIFAEETADSISAHSGTWYAWIGGSQSDIGVMLSPAFEIPPSTQWLGLRGYRYFAFDSAAGVTDYARVDMYDADGDFTVAEEQFFEWDNADHDTNSWVLFEAEVPRGPYTGISHYISVVGVTDDTFDADPMDVDGQFASNFFFDDLSYQAFVCKKK